MSRNKFIPLPEHPPIVKCAVTKCGKERPLAEMINLGNNVFACKTHRASTRMKGIPRQAEMLKMDAPKKVWKIDFHITGTIEEG